MKAPYITRAEYESLALMPAGLNEVIAYPNPGNSFLSFVMRGPVVVNGRTFIYVPSVDAALRDDALSYIMALRKKAPTQSPQVQERLL